MRRAIALVGGAVGLAALGAAHEAGAQLDRGPAPAPCSVLGAHPCHPSFCGGVFHPGPCLPEILPPPIGQDWRLTIAATEEKSKDKPANDRSEDHYVNTIQEMFHALNACWIPPPPGKSQPGMEYTVRFAFKANGELMGPPRVTYTTRGVSEDVRNAYQQAMEAALKRCTPMHFTRGMAGAIAGRPITIHFLDDRIVPAHFSRTGDASGRWRLSLAPKRKVENLNKADIGALSDHALSSVPVAICA
jgi:hypothetical protein